MSVIDDVIDKVNSLKIGQLYSRMELAEELGMPYRKLEYAFRKMNLTGMIEHKRTKEGYKFIVIKRSNGDIDGEIRAQDEAVKKSDMRLSIALNNFIFGSKRISSNHDMQSHA